MGDDGVLFRARKTISWLPLPKKVRKRNTYGLAVSRLRLGISGMRGSQYVTPSKPNIKPISGDPGLLAWFVDAFWVNHIL